MPSRLILIVRCWLQLLVQPHLHSFILCLSLRTKTSGIQGKHWTETSTRTGKISWAMRKSKGKAPFEQSQTFLNGSYVRECVSFVLNTVLSNLEFRCMNSIVGRSEIIENSLCEGCSFEGFLALGNRPRASFDDIWSFKSRCLLDIEKRSVVDVVNAQYFSPQTTNSAAERPRCFVM